MGLPPGSIFDASVIVTDRRYFDGNFGARSKRTELSRVGRGRPAVGLAEVVTRFTND